MSESGSGLLLAGGGVGGVGGGRGGGFEVGFAGGGGAGAGGGIAALGAGGAGGGGTVAGFGDEAEPPAETRVGSLPFFVVDEAVGRKLWTVPPPLGGEAPWVALTGLSDDGLGDEGPMLVAAKAEAVGRPAVG